MDRRLLAVVSLALLVACTGPTTDNSEPGLPNPASVYCVEQGGELEIVTTSTGEQGICRFRDGSSCDEWAYFRGECQPGDRP
ncbi:MAG: DUF333 domain-containing protein [Nitriliruptoraceae bacterium]